VERAESRVESRVRAEMMMWQAGIAGIAGLTQKSVKIGSFTESLVPPCYTPTEYDLNI
jgi:hypothetical protein